VASVVIADGRLYTQGFDEAKNLDRIVAFTGTGEQLLRRIDASSKHVVVRLDGLSLGGGSELALCAACAAAVAAEDHSPRRNERGPPIALAA